MPKAIAGAALIAGAVVLDVATGGAATPLAAQMLMAGISMEAGAIAHALGSHSGIGITTRQAAAFRQLIYGEYRVGAVNTYRSTTGSHHDQFNFIDVLAGHQIDSIPGAYLDGRLVYFQGSGTGYSVRNGVGFGGIGDSGNHVGPGGQNYNFGGTGHAGIYFEARYGDHTATSAGPSFAPGVPGLITALTANDGAWNTSGGETPLCLGCALVYFKAEFNQDLFPSEPERRYTVRGKNNIWDPRTGTYGWTNNWALIVADMITDTTWGLGDVGAVNQAQLIAAANVCDEMVTLANGNTEKRYTLNKAYDASVSAGDMLDDAMKAAGGRLSLVGGEYFIFPRYWQGSSRSFSQGMLTGPVQWKPYRSLKDRCNRVRGTYMAPNVPYNDAGNLYDSNGWYNGTILNQWPYSWHPTNYPQFAADVLHGYASDAYLETDSGVLGGWTSGTIYGLGDAVTYLGVIYKSLIAGNLAIEPDTHSWAGAGAAGVYSAGTTYALGDAAVYTSAPRLQNLIQNSDFSQSVPTGGPYGAFTLTYWDELPVTSLGDTVSGSSANGGEAIFNHVSGVISGSTPYEIIAQTIDVSRWAVGDYLMLSGALEDSAQSTANVGNAELTLWFLDSGGAVISSVSASTPLGGLAPGFVPVHTASTQVPVGTAQVRVGVFLDGASWSFQPGSTLTVTQIQLEESTPSQTVPRPWVVSTVSTAPQLYVSLVAANTGNQPDTSPTDWAAVLWVAYENLLPQQLDLDNVISIAQAQRLAKIALLTNRQEGRGTLPLHLACYGVQPLDVITLDNPDIGWSGKVLEVVNTRFFVEPDPNDDKAQRVRFEVDVQETDSSVYAWSTTEELTAYDVPANPAATPWGLDAPTGLVLSSSSATAILGADGVNHPRILAVWNTSSEDARATQIRAQHRLHGGATWIDDGTVTTGVGAIYIGGVVAGTVYDVQIRAEGSNGSTSGWTEVDNVTAAAPASLQASYTNSPVVALSQPTSTTIAMAAVATTFGSRVVNYAARTLTISAPSVDTWYYFTIADPTQVGESGSPTLTATCSTSNALVGVQGNTYMGAILAKAAGGATRKTGGGWPAPYTSQVGI